MNFLLPLFGMKSLIFFNWNPRVAQDWSLHKYVRTVYAPTFNGRPLISIRESASWIWLSSRSLCKLSCAEPKSRLLRKRLKAKTWISISSLSCNWLAMGQDNAWKICIPKSNQYVLNQQSYTEKSWRKIFQLLCKYLINIWCIAMILESFGEVRNTWGWLNHYVLSRKSFRRVSDFTNFLQNYRHG